MGMQMSFEIYVFCVSRARYYCTIAFVDYLKAKYDARRVPQDQIEL